MSRQQCQAIFKSAKARSRDLGNVAPVLQEHLLFMDLQIRNKMSSFTLLSICGTSDRNKFVVDQRFDTAFNSMTLMESALYYRRTIDYAYKGTRQEKPQRESDDLELKQETHTKILVRRGYRSWEETKVCLKEFKMIFQDRFTIDLRNYLMRDSKDTQKKCIVLEAIRKIEPENIRFAFNPIEHDNYLPIFRRHIQRSHYENVLTMAEITKVHHLPRESTEAVPNSNLMQADQQEYRYQNEDQEDLGKPPFVERRNQRMKTISILEDLLKEAQDLDLSQQLPELVQKIDSSKEGESEVLQSYQNVLGSVLKQRKKKHKCIMGTILPQFRLKELAELAGYVSVYSNSVSNTYIYRKADNPSVFKMEMTVDVPAKVLVNMVTNIELYKIWNGEVTDGNIKLKLMSENTVIAYQKHRGFSDWYRDRDFLFIRHLFASGDQFFLIDKSIESNHFIPFQSITRGSINYAVWRIQQTGTHEQSSLLLEIDLDHSGLVKASYQEELTLRYLKGFEGLKSYFKTFEARQKLTSILDLEWFVDLQGEELSQVESIRSLRTEDFENNEKEEITDQKGIDEEDIFYSLEDDSLDSPGKSDYDDKSEHQIRIQDHEKGASYSTSFHRLEEEVVKLNQDGLAILPREYLSKRHIRKPVEGAFFPLLKNTWKHYLLRDDWELLPGGGLKLVNQKKIDAQNNVFAFILRTLKKNLLSGKGMTGISLPVEIFNSCSNLQRNCFMYTYAPFFLQAAAKEKDPLERLKLIIPFGVASAMLCSDSQKPFNPILGETYQGIIAGCPIYAEQISHHPPITAVYMVGRGYKLYSCIQQKVNFHMNSAEGVNEGFTTVEFDDGQKVHFQNPGGELSGMIHGDRKLNFKGKSYFFDSKNQLFCELKFDENVGFFGKAKWEFSDQFEGKLLGVTEEFLQKFIQKKTAPNNSQILQTYYKIEGRWPVETFVGGEKVFVVNDQLPYELQDYPCPLSSNTNYREDLFYRKLENIARSQIEKERMEKIQRNDRKLRAKLQEAH